MPAYVAFLRAVNVGGRKYPMAELRAALAAAGYDGVATHIQTGNVLLSSGTRSPAKLEAALEAVFEADRGFEVPTIVFTTRELRQITADADDVAGDSPPKFAHYVELLRSAPTVEQTAAIEGQRWPGQRAVVRGRAVHLLFDIPYHEAKGPNAEIKRAYGVSTNRNLKVIRALADKWC